MPHIHKSDNDNDNDNDSDSDGDDNKHQTLNMHACRHFSAGEVATQEKWEGIAQIQDNKIVLLPKKMN